MADPAERYRKLIDATLRTALAARLDRPLPDGLTMELALPAIAWRMGLVPRDDAKVKEAGRRLAALDSRAPVRDGGGHTRSLYRPLLATALASTIADQPTAAVAHLPQASLLLAHDFATATPPPAVREGDDVAARLLHALVLTSELAGLIDPTRAGGVARAAFDRLVRHQSSEGRFLASTSADQLEPAWYHELAVLHAVDRYARKSGDAAAIAAVKRSARYHAEQVQPDHASSHPFGLAALLEDAEGIFLADMMLHTAGVQQPATMDAVSLVLLFDAIDAGR